MSNLVERWKKQLACYRAGFRSSINEQIIIDTIEALKPVEDAEVRAHIINIAGAYPKAAGALERLAREKADLQAKVEELTELVASLEEVRAKEYAFKQAKVEELKRELKIANTFAVSRRKTIAYLITELDSHEDSKGWRDDLENRLKIWRKQESEWVSECCNAPDNEPYFSMGICSKCKEHCDYIDLMDPNNEQ